MLGNNKNPLKLKKKIIKINCFFQVHIIHLKPFITEIGRYNRLLPNYISKPAVINGQKEDQENSEFTTVWKGIGELHFRCVKSSAKDDGTSLYVWKVKAEMCNSVYEFRYSFHWDSSNKSTLFSWEIVFEDSSASIMIDDVFEAHKEYCQLLSRQFSAYSKYLQSSTKQTEATLVNCRENDVTQLLTNWKNLIKISPEMGTHVTCEENLRINSELILRQKNNQQINLLRVVEMEHSKNQNFKLVVNFEKGNHRSPKQSLTFAVRQIKDNLSWLEFTHTFEEQVAPKLIEALATGKKKVLSRVKKYLESNL